jgi:hypothetical protein
MMWLRWDCAVLKLMLRVLPTVDGQVKDFDGVNACDKVVVRYTEALALRMISQ